jgi:hypothetical protein
MARGSRSSTRARSAGSRSAAAAGCGRTCPDSRSSTRRIQSALSCSARGGRSSRRTHRGYASFSPALSVRILFVGGSATRSAVGAASLPVSVCRRARVPTRSRSARCASPAGTRARVTRSLLAGSSRRRWRGARGRRRARPCNASATAFSGRTPCFGATAGASAHESSAQGTCEPCPDRDGGRAA